MFSFELNKNVFVTYIIIQSITSSEMCSLHLTHPSAHTPGAVGTVHSGKAPAWPPHVSVTRGVSGVKKPNAALMNNKARSNRQGSEAITGVT